MKEQLYEVTNELIKHENDRSEINSVLALLRSWHKVDINNAEFTRIMQQLYWNDYKKSKIMTANDKVLTLLYSLLIFFAYIVTVGLVLVLFKVPIIYIVGIFIVLMLGLYIHRQRFIGKLKENETPLHTKNWESYLKSRTYKHYFLPSNKQKFTKQEISASVVANNHKLRVHPYSYNEIHKIALLYVSYLGRLDVVTYDQYLELYITKDEMKNFISSLLNDYKHDLQITSQGFYKYLNLKLEEFNK